MASSIILDTNGWLTLLNRIDTMHSQANAAWTNIVRNKRPLILTDWIVAEVGNGLSRAKDKARLAEALDRILQVPRNELVYMSDELLRNSFALFGQHTDKSWALSIAQASS